MRALGERQVVRDEDERGVRLVVEFLEHADDHGARLHVEVAGRRYEGPVVNRFAYQDAAPGDRSPAAP